MKGKIVQQPSGLRVQYEEMFECPQHGHAMKNYPQVPIALGGIAYAKEHIGGEIEFELVNGVAKIKIK